jgi:hypothetical protein
MSLCLRCTYRPPKVTTVNENPNTIAIDIPLQREVEASRADLTVRIEGHATFSGGSALKKAREIRDLVERLAEAGVPESAVRLRSAKAQVTSGLISKSSTVKYVLRIEVPSRDLVAAALGAVTSVKNAELVSLEWQYDDLDAVHEQLLREALILARDRAAVICEALAQRTTVVHRLNENFDRRDGGPQMPQAQSFVALKSRAAAPAMSNDSFGFELSESKTVHFRLHVEYRVEAGAS